MQKQAQLTNTLVDIRINVVTRTETNRSTKNNDKAQEHKNKGSDKVLDKKEIGD